MLRFSSHHHGLAILKAASWSNSVSPLGKARYSGPVACSPQPVFHFPRRASPRSRSGSLKQAGPTSLRGFFVAGCRPALGSDYPQIANSIARYALPGTALNKWLLNFEILLSGCRMLERGNKFSDCFPSLSDGARHCSVIAWYVEVIRFSIALSSSFEIASAARAFRVEPTIVAAPISVNKPTVRR